MDNLYNPSVWLDNKRHCLLFLRETPQNVEFVQHVDRTVTLLRMEHDAFHHTCTQDASISVASFVDTLLGTARNGVVITPAARFALTQVNSSTPNKEANMAAKIPTKPTGKVAPKKPAPAKQEPLPLDTAKVMSGPTAKNPDSKVSPVDPDHGVHPVPGGAVKTVPVAPAKPAPALAPKRLTVAQAAAMEAPVSSLEQVINEEPTEAPAPDLAMMMMKAPRATAEPDFLREAQQIVNAATAQAAQMVQEAKDLLEVAVKKTEEKRALDDARAEAKKILDKAKAEVAKIRAAVAKLGGKKPRGKAKAEGEAKAARTVYDIEDFKGRKITKLVEPVVRGDSARGALTVTVANCKSTDEALEYQGATPAFIMKMVEGGLISVE